MSNRTALKAKLEDLVLKDPHFFPFKTKLLFKTVAELEDFTFCLKKLKTLPSDSQHWKQLSNLKTNLQNKRLKQYFKNKNLSLISEEDSRYAQESIDH